MIRQLLFASIFIGMVFSGCIPVVIEEPVGTPVHEDLSKTFDGIWQTENGDYIFYVKSKPNGILRVAAMEMRNERFIARDTLCMVTRLGGWTYLNVPTPPDSAGKRFYIFAPILDDGRDRIVAFIPGYDFFKKAIDEKELIGTSHGELLKHVRIKKPAGKFFETNIGEIIRSSNFVILERTLRGEIKTPWPYDK